MMHYLHHTYVTINYAKIDHKGDSKGMKGILKDNEVQKTLDPMH